MKLNDIFFKQKFTHIGFYSEGDIIIWNEIHPDAIKSLIYTSFPRYDKVHELKIKYKISDKDLLLNKENQEYFFLLKDDGEIFYFNVGHIVSKNIFTNASYKGIEFTVLLDDTVHKNTYPYSFIFKNKLTFFNEINIEACWNLLTNTMINQPPAIQDVDLHFIWEELFNVSSYLGIKNPKDYKKFTLVLKKDQEAIITY